MPLTNTQKDMLTGTISHLFDFSECNQDQLRQNILNISEAIMNYMPGSHPYEQFSRIFHSPEIIYRIADCGSGATIGEAQECMIEYIDSQIMQGFVQQITHKKPGHIRGINPGMFKQVAADLKWNKNTFIETIKGRQDYTYPIAIKKLPSSQWSEVEPERWVSNDQTLGYYQENRNRWVIIDAEMAWRGFTGPIADGIRYLIGTVPNLSIQAASERLDGLTPPQMNGVIMRLSREQVEAPEFGEHTIEGILRLMDPPSGLNLYTAYEQLQGLAPHQINGVFIGLSRQQLKAPRFGDHTVEGILRLMEPPFHLDLHAAYEQLQGLVPHQVSGVLIGLTPKDVTDPRFMKDTAEAIPKLMTPPHSLNAKEAYDALIGLTANQVNGVILGLTREHVTEPHFKRDTAYGIGRLMELRPGSSAATIYTQLKELDLHQIEGIIMGLEHDQVKAPDFGCHIVDGIRHLKGMKPDLSLSEAHNQTTAAIRCLVKEYPNFSPARAFVTFKELPQHQLEGMAIGLTYQQVKAPGVTSHTIEEVKNLRATHPSTSLEDLYSQVYQAPLPCSAMTHASTEESKNSEKSLGHL